MAELSAAKRKKIPKSQHGLPEKAKTAEDKAAGGSYPMPDKEHAANAKARATQQYKKGNLSKAERDRIHKKADRKLGNT